MPTITSANSVLTIGVTGLFAVPQNLQGFADDDAYSMDSIDNAEVKMGVDGIMSYGWIPQIKSMSVMLQADSKSADFWERWYAAEEQAREKLPAFGSLLQQAVGKSYTLSNGVLTGFAPIADAGKVLKPRRFQIKWNSVIASPI